MEGDKINFYGNQYFLFFKVTQREQEWQRQQEANGRQLMELQAIANSRGEEVRQLKDQIKTLNSSHNVIFVWFTANFPQWHVIKKGFTVLSAVNGKEGIDKSITEKPDLILMDLSLPIINGWDATKEIKANEETSSIPIIALTAHAMAEDRKKALDAGCDEYDTKPIEFEGLLKKINKLIGE